MTDDLHKRFEEAVRANDELTRKLQLAETEIASLKSANERLGNRLLTITEKLEDANNEVARMGMVLKHRDRDRDMWAARRLDKQSEWPHLAAPSSPLRGQRLPEERVSVTGQCSER